MSFQNLSQLKREIFRDMTAKQSLAQRMARVGRSFACDAAETETAEDYCRRMLEKLGLKAGADPIQGLSYFLDGHDSIARKASMGMDSASDSIIDRYFRGEI